MNCTHLTCTNCTRTKPADEFRRVTSQSKCTGYCKLCAKERDKRDYHAKGKTRDSARMMTLSGHIKRVLNNSIKNAAKRKGKAQLVTVDIEYLERLYSEQQGRCHWTGIPMELSHEPRHPYQPSLDRLDPSQGYIPGNVAWTTLAMNNLRNTMGVDATLEFIQRIKES